MNLNSLMKWVILNILIFYILSEIILLILDLPKEYNVHTHPPQFQRISDNNILYVNLPNSNIEFKYDGNPRNYFRSNNTVIHHTNKIGFRGSDFSITKTPNVKRFIFLGDSFTFGEGVYDEDTYPEKFSKFIGEKKIFGSEEIEAINLGVGGYNTQQEWTLLKNYADQLKPDYIVIGYVLNDAEPYLFTPMGEGMVRKNRENTIPENLSTIIEAPFLIKISRLNKLIWQTYQKNKRTQQLTTYYLSLYEDDQLDWISTKKIIAEIGKYSQTQKIPMIIVIFPILYRLDQYYPFNVIHDKLHQLFKQNNLTYIDLLPLFLGKKDQDLWVHPTDQHPNELVHEVAAQALVKMFNK
ncbi:hypothetical protein A2960_00180 [Candidatus Gottesmanbacteria bacterium RIFCSPLOWO2_01_FULL_39_12b]|uniref:SGNH hydrolase-type esterase domain-containing protein n=1 Tax=Candidatus Gottesmanbacteria bacterium RIFCSPLOWO2_01_FULL_39_12b TaxID=1798388 RepID=A0A1F6ART3_9BACT|nr:MAG: hypothetical protein A2960_00180 [Candidatus Gottesmanbacteria bacterium RIFCSPLOWO2_01_FULL_39_12b]